MFTCPRCGSHEFRTRTFGNGQIERECMGQIEASKTVAITKDAIGHGRRAVFNPAAGATQVERKHGRACTFLWSPEDDEKVGLATGET